MENKMQDHLESEEIIEEILNIKEVLGERLIILTHRYQSKEIIDIGDYCSDTCS